jgi:hypothetical protein
MNENAGKKIRRAMLWSDGLPTRGECRNHPGKDFSDFLKEPCGWLRITQ